MLIRCLLAATLLACIPIASANAADPIDTLLDSAGLGGLDEQEHASARTLVRRLLLRGASDATLNESAAEYMRNEGYQPISLEIVTADGKDFLVARTGLSTYATDDVPILLNKYSFRAGQYFAKSSLMGGVSEFVDQRGDIQRLLFAKWFRVKD